MRWLRTRQITAISPPEEHVYFPYKTSGILNYTPARATADETEVLSYIAEARTTGEPWVRMSAR